MQVQQVGIFGGSFDPIHYGHLAMAEEVRWSLGLNCIYLIPNAHQPFKREGHGATPEQRLEMIRRACAQNDALIPLDIEVRRPPPSFTIDTLRELCQRLGEATRLWLLLGGDAISLFPQWKAARSILELVRLAVVDRPGSPADFAALERAMPGILERVDLVAAPQMALSSSALRQRLAGGRPVRYQLPDPVLEYIMHHGLYQKLVTSGE
ncbi:MAG: nicotinate (nicotinamide) nucleotide adenylyltransferase [Chloroflexaceae bacterium]|nr:nicotinate (nicotinamide) nucleotide adenylyltransferase [Chloroflexaceae bacterium]